LTSNPLIESMPMRTGEAYEARVVRILSELGIPASYGVDRHMPLQEEATDLVSVGIDIYGRDRQLTPEAAAGWADLQTAAGRAACRLQRGPASIGCR